MPLHFSPDFESVSSALMRGDAVAVWSQLIADTDTPISVLLKLQEHVPAFFLESAENSLERGRYSVIGIHPDAQLQIVRDRVTVSGALSPDLEALSPPEAIRKFVASSTFPIDPDLPPMAAGVFGYLGYACVRFIEPTVPDDNPDILNVPDAWMFRPSMTITHDRLRETLLLTTVLRPESFEHHQDDHNLRRSAYQAAYEAAQERLLSIASLLDAPAPSRRFAPYASEYQNKEADQAAGCVSRAEYCAAVERAREYILAGDAFQIVLAQRFSTQIEVSALEIYRAVRRINPSPYMYYIDFGEMQIVGASPETLVRLRGGEITIRPLAGSAPRGATPEEDDANEQALLADEKECAEHLMLLDLGRNDVGRTAKIGSVRVRRPFAIERYSHIMHISSTVTGEIADGHDGLSALLAGFPAGTLSGAPKVRAMQIIDELETERRGIYAGGIGYFGANGDMEICIVLRTGVVKDQTLHVTAGAGVVADSNPDREYQECRTKARAMFKAVEEAERICSTYRANS